MHIETTRPHGLDLEPRHACKNCAPTPPDVGSMAFVLAAEALQEHWQDNDDGDEGPPEAPPTPSDDMDLEDRSPEPTAHAAEPEPDPEPEPAFPDMELESPTHDAAPPATFLAGKATSACRLGRTRRDTLLGLCQGSGAAPSSGTSAAAIMQKQRWAGLHAIVPAGHACNPFRMPYGASVNPACGCMMFYLGGPAGARPGATGVPSGPGAPPGVAPIRTQPLHGGETRGAPAAEAPPAPLPDAPAALDGASTGAGTQVRPAAVRVRSWRPVFVKRHELVAQHTAASPLLVVETCIGVAVGCAAHVKKKTAGQRLSAALSFYSM